MYDVPLVIMASFIDSKVSSIGDVYSPQFANQHS